MISLVDTSLPAFVPIVACPASKSALTASTPGADLMAFSALDSHVYHVMPSMLITHRSMSAVNISLDEKSPVSRSGKNRKTMTSNVTTHNMTLFIVIRVERRLRFEPAALLLSSRIPATRAGRYVR